MKYHMLVIHTSKIRTTTIVGILWIIQYKSFKDHCTSINYVFVIIYKLKHDYGSEPHLGSRRNIMGLREILMSTSHLDFWKFNIIIIKFGSHLRMGSILRSSLKKMKSVKYKKILLCDNSEKKTNKLNQNNRIEIRKTCQ